jgi:hypothetical protein
MTTQTIDIPNDDWIDIKNQLSLENGVAYRLHNNGPRSLFFAEVSVKPENIEVKVIILPGNNLPIFTVEGIGLWAISDQEETEVAVRDDRTLVGTETNGGIPVNVQDQTSPPVEHFLYQILQPVTIVGDYSIGNNIITFAAGHGFTDPAGFVNDYLVINYIDETQPTNNLKYRFYQGRVVGVDVNDVTFAIPLGFNIENAKIDSSFRVNVNMALASGSLASPAKFFTTPVNGVEWDLTRIMIDMITEAQPDDGKFGGDPALVNGLFFGFESIATNFFEFLVNIQDNGDFRATAYDVQYPNRSVPQGSFGVSVRKTFAGQDKYGVAIRLDGITNDEFVSYIQDDLPVVAPNLDRLRMKIMGHLTTD